MSKKGFLFKLLMILVVSALLFVVFMKFANAETSTDIINFTLRVNSSDIILNISNTIYSFNNSNFAISMQQNFSVFFSNTTNATINTSIVCNNASISLSCNCPVASCPSCPSINCALQGEVDLTNSTKTLLLNHYTTTLKTQIEESSNKVATDIAFRLEPTKVQLDEYRNNALNASIKQVEAERVRDDFAKSNLVLTGQNESCRKDNRLLSVAIYSIIFVIFFILITLNFSDWKNKLQGRI